MFAIFVGASLPVLDVDLVDLEKNGMWVAFVFLTIYTIISELYINRRNTNGGNGYETSLEALFERSAVSGDGAVHAAGDGVGGHGDSQRKLWRKNVLGIDGGWDTGGVRVWGDE